MQVSFSQPRAQFFKGLFLAFDRDTIMHADAVFCHRDHSSNGCFGKEDAKNNQPLGGVCAICIAQCNYNRLPPAAFTTKFFN